MNMQTPQAVLIKLWVLILFSLSTAAYADRIGETSEQEYRKREAIRTFIQQLYKAAPQSEPENDFDPEAEADFDRQTRSNSGQNQTRPFGDGPLPFEDMAKKCGTEKQAECTPDKMGGRTMCGRAVAKMLECMKTTVGGSAKCTGRCGNGKDFVNCQNKEMETCGYQKIDDPKDERCRMPGAVLAYTKSPTARGAMYGHVEFVCGRDEYCSVYTKKHERPWPRSPADSCWYPKNATASNTRGPR